MSKQQLALLEKLPQIVFHLHENIDDVKNTVELCNLVEAIFQNGFKKYKQKSFYDYFYDCLCKDVEFSLLLNKVKSNSDVTTAVGRGRCFIAIVLNEQLLGIAVQHSILNYKCTKSWYNSNSLLRKELFSEQIVNSFYALNDVKFSISLDFKNIDNEWCFTNMDIDSLSFKIDDLSSYDDSISFSNDSLITSMNSQTNFEYEDRILRKVARQESINRELSSQITAIKKHLASLNKNYNKKISDVECLEEELQWYRSHFPKQNEPNIKENFDPDQSSSFSEGYCSLSNTHLSEERFLHNSSDDVTEFLDYILNELNLLDSDRHSLVKELALSSVNLNRPLMKSSHWAYIIAEIKKQRESLCKIDVSEKVDKNRAVFDERYIKEKSKALFLEKELEEMTNSFNNLQQVIDLFTNRCNECFDKYTDLNDANKALKLLHEERSFLNKIAVLNEERWQAAVREVNLVKKSQAQTSSETDTLAQIAELKNSVTELLNSEKQLSDRVSEKDLEILYRESTLSGLRDQFQVLESDFNALFSDKQKLMSEIEMYSSFFARVSLTARDLALNENTPSFVLDAIKFIRSFDQNECKLVKSDLSFSEQSIFSMELSNKCGESLLILEAMRDRLQLDPRSKILLSDVKKIISDINDMQCENNSLLKSIDNLKAEVNELKQMSNAIKSTNQLLEKKILELSTEIDAKNLELTKNNLELKFSLDVRNKENEDLRVRIERFAAAIDSKSDEITKLCEEKYTYENEIKSLQLENDALNKKLEDLPPIEKLQDDIFNLKKESLRKESKFASEKKLLNDDCQLLKQKIIEVTKEKDKLWQNLDHLQYVGQTTFRGSWINDALVRKCTNCKQEFSLTIRKHHCRMCGRIFCYNCCNFWIELPHSRTKERVCGECEYNKREIDAYLSCSVVSTPNLSKEQKADIAKHVTSNAETSTISRKKSFPKAKTFDSLEVYGSQESLNTSTSRSEVNSSTADSSFSTEISLAGMSSTNDSMEAAMCRLARAVVQNPITKDSFQEIMLSPEKSITIPIVIEFPGRVISWTFTSEPKSVYFLVSFISDVFQFNSEETMLSHHLHGQQIIIPLCRCQSHKESISGKLISKKSGTYLLYFDNSRSRFTHKRIKINVSIDRP